MSRFVQGLVVGVLGVLVATTIKFDIEQRRYNQEQVDFDRCVVGGLAVGRKSGLSLDDGGLDLGACLQLSPDLPFHVPDKPVGSESIGS